MKTCQKKVTDCGIMSMLTNNNLMLLRQIGKTQ